MRENSKKRLRRLIVGSLVVILTIVAAAAYAEKLRPGGDCPSRDAVADAVRGLLSQSHVEIENIESDVQIRDLGPGFTVVARGRTREFDDVDRDCVRRARVAAVFVALTLAPPNIDLPDDGQERPAPPAAAPLPAKRPPPLPQRPPPRRPPPVTRPSPGIGDGSWSIGLEIGALAAATPVPDRWRGAFGAELRLVAARPTWGLSMGSTIEATDEIAIRTSRIRERRYSADGGFRWDMSRAWVSASADLGVVFAVLKLKQVNANEPPDRTLLDVGGRAGLSLRVGHSTITAFVRGFVELFPLPHTLAVEPRGALGTTSWVWLGGTIGLAASFH